LSATEHALQGENSQLVTLAAQYKEQLTHAEELFTRALTSSLFADHAGYLDACLKQDEMQSLTEQMQHLQQQLLTETTRL
ncbi:hypothetical protein V6255_18215, partial [Psychromonas arctica]